MPAQPVTPTLFTQGAFFERSVRHGDQICTLFVSNPGQIHAARDFLTWKGITAGPTALLQLSPTKDQPAATFHGLSLQQQDLAMLRSLSLPEINTGAYTGAERNQLVRAAVNRLQFARENREKLAEAEQKLGAVAEILRTQAWLVTPPSENGSVRLYLPASEVAGMRTHLASAGKGAFIHQGEDTESPFHDATYLQTNAPLLTTLLEKLVPSHRKQLEATQEVREKVGTPNSDALLLKEMLDGMQQQDQDFAAALKSKTYLYHPEKGEPRLVFVDEAARTVVRAGLIQTPGFGELMDVPTSGRALQNGARALTFPSLALNGVQARALSVLAAAVGTSSRRPSRFEEPVAVPRVAKQPVMVEEMIRNDHPLHPNVAERRESTLRG